MGRTTSIPTRAELAYFASKGMNVIRVPFRWEVLQPAAEGAAGPR